MHSRRTNLVLAAIEALVKAGMHGFMPADVNAQLRASGEPMLPWEIRGELSVLEASGEICVDPVTAVWSMRVDDAAKAKTG